MADEFKIVASLDIPKSVDRINNVDIPKLRGQTKHLKIIADLDPKLSIKNIQATLNKMNNNANIKIGIDTSGLNSVQGATQNITNNLKSVQTQAQQTAKSIEKTLTTISADNISDKMVKEFQNSFGIIGKKASETKAIFKDLFATLNNAWYAGDLVKYNSTLTKIYDTTIDNVNASKQLSKEAKNIVDFYKNQLTDGSKVFIDPNVRTELEYILGTSEKIKSVLSTVFGVGKWSYQSGISVDSLSNLIHYDDEIRSSADSIVDAYNKIQQAKSQNFSSLYDTKYGTDAIKQQAQSLLNLKDVYVDLNGVEHNFVEGLGWFESIGEETKNIETETNAIEKQTKATEKLKAIRESITRDTNGQQISRTSVYGDTGFTRTSYYNEKDELTSYTDTENYQKLEQQLAKIEEVRAKYNRLLSDFKSSNSAIQSGLTQPIQQFENVLNGLGKTSSINDVKNAFESLKQSASEITAYLDTTNSSFNKATNAVNNYKNMDNVLKEMTASFNNLVMKPENLRTELDGVKSKLVELQNLEKTEGGYTKAWAEKYREVNLELAQVKTNIELALKAEGSSQKADKNSAYQTQLKYLNKIKEETNTIISLKRKMVNAGDEEKSVYQHEITNAQKRIQYDVQQLDKKKLLTDEAKRLVNTYKEQIALQDKINSAKTSDKNVQAQSQQLKDYVTQVSKAIVQLNSLQNSPTFTKNASNPQVTQTKQDINSLITAYQNLATKLQGNITPAGLETVRTELTQLNARFNTATATAKQFESELKNDNGAEKLAQRVALLKAQLEALAKANPKALKRFGDEINSLMATLNNSPDGRAVEQVAKDIQLLRREINNADLAGKTFFQKLKDNASKFTGWMSMTYAISLFTRSVREAVVELKEVDTLLTEISKANDKLTKSQLAEIGSNSFGIASKYGKTATDYLSGVQEMSRAGYTNAEAMGELSTAAQGAGDMTADVANQFIIAADKAYKMNGSVEQLTKTLDGINYITNNNAVNMSELSEGFSIVSSTAAASGVSAKELTAALGTMAATTQQSGSEVARAFRAILLNIRQVSDEEEGIDAEGLTKYEKACNDLGVSLKEVKDGVLQLRDPMQVLKELSIEYNKLSETDLKRTNLLNSVGGKLRSTQLDALLRQWSMYEEMLQQYEAGNGSMAREANNYCLVA